MSDVTLHLGDCLEVMRSLPDKSVDAVITDPPYNIGFSGYSSYEDNLSDSDYIGLLSEMGRFPVAVIHYPEEMMRYVVPALGVPDHVGAWCYNSNIPRRFRLINFYKLDPDYSRVKQPYKNPSDSRVKALIDGGSKGANLYEWFSDIQLVKNVSAEKTDHPCPVPVALIERIILLTTNEGDTILDPFMGSGTTGVACVQTGRNFIGIEIDEGYYNIAAKRIAEAQQQMVMPI